MLEIFLPNESNDVDVIGVVSNLVRFGKIPGCKG